MTRYPTDAATAEAVRLINEAFEARLAARRAQSQGMPHLAEGLLAAADNLGKTARSLETAAQEIGR
jgi:hypothetical protein